MAMAKAGATAGGEAPAARVLKVLLLSRYTALGASSRLRHLQYLPALRRHGLDVTAAPFFDDGYLETLYAGRRPPLGGVLASYARRVRTLLGAGGYDLLWIEKELLPWVPFAVERLPGGRIPYVVDYDDAWFHRYDRHRLGPVRWWLGDKIDRVMRHAALVVAGNDYLAERAGAAGARHVAIVPTVVDLAHYPPTENRDDGPFTVTWIGTPQTAPYLRTLAAPLAAACRGGRLRLIGAGDRVELPGVRIEHRPWSEATEVADIAAGDVGIMPLRDELWERGKCGYKLIQYMACRRPVVASPVGVNTAIVEHGVNGFLARDDADWLDALTLLRADSDRRRRLGEAGRRRVEEHYALDRAAPRMAQLMIAAWQRHHRREAEHDSISA